MLLLLYLAIPQQVPADTTPGLQTLINNGHLEVRTILSQTKDIIARQKLILTLEVATDTWLAKNSRVESINADNALVIQNTIPPVNSTRLENGKTMSIHQWTTIIYPETNGEIVIHPLTLHLSIAGKNNKWVSGKIQTEKILFLAKIPPQFKNLTHWVVASTFSVTDEFNRSLNDLKPGDSLQRTITFSASGVDSVMLPQIQYKPISGLDIYQNPAQITNEPSKDQSTVTRIEKITYVVEKGGNYTLAPFEFHWWDLSSMEAKTILLSQKTINDFEKTRLSELFDQVKTLLSKWGKTNRLQVIWVAGFIVGGMIIIVLTFRYRHRSNKKQTTKDRQTTRETARHLKRKILTACKKQEHSLMLKNLYLWIDLYGKQNKALSLYRPGKKTNLDKKLIGELVNVMANVYGQKKNIINTRELLAEVKSLFAREKGSLKCVLKIKTRWKLN
ncbi:BatD family protein [bacterium]|nr:BatD family protein [bacterium]